VKNVWNLYVLAKMAFLGSLCLKHNLVLLSSLTRRGQLLLFVFLSEVMERPLDHLLLC
jgi:hypothetical protein